MATENNFSVYRIWAPTSPLQYIGSTTQTLSQRLGGHARDYRYWVAGKYHYVSSYEIMKLPGVRIELIETVTTTSKQVLHAREGHYIRTLDCVNKSVVGRTKAEYEATRYAAHRVEIAARIGVKYDCQCGGKYTHGAIARHIKTKRHLAHLATLAA